MDMNCGNRRRFIVSGLVAAALLGTSALGASAHENEDASGRADAGDHAVFVQTNDPAGNQVLAYQRARNGALGLAGTYDAGGTGGRVEGSAVDPLASQDSLVYDARHELLIGVNAGSDAIYAFHVEGDRLTGRDVVSSGGSFPVSVAVHGNLVYALNAGGMGSVQGYRVDDGHLRPIADSLRTLGLTPVSGPATFLNTPGQIGFTPDGDHLIVTTKANGSHIDVFNVGRDGELSATPVQNTAATPVPFGFTFDARDRLVVGEAATSSVSTYVVQENGSLRTIASQSDSQAALCWIARADRLYFVANSGSGTVSSYRVDASGHPSVVSTTAVGPGPIDLVATRGGSFLYVQLGGNGMVAGFKVNADGSLTPVGTVAAHPGMEGLVAI